MAKAKSYKFQGREWTVKDLAEELGLSTPRVHGLLKEHNENIKAIFASRGITPKPADKGPKARLFDYKGKQWTVKQLAEEFGLSNVRVNNLIRQYDGDIEKIALSREKSKKTVQTEKTPKNNPPQPNKSQVNFYLREWKTLKKYKMQEESLNLLFNEWPENKELEQILLKVSALNDFYSTNIFDTYTVAKHILKCNIDKDLSAGNEALVNKIAPVTINGKTRNFYSFASKYCNHHKSESYPIYDYYVDKMLMHFKKKDKFDTFINEDLKEYQSFVERIKNFQKYYDLSAFTLRDIDIYLWLAGKNYFPRKKQKKKNK